MSSRYTVQDYTRALQNLMPLGIAWPRDTESVQYKLLSGLAIAFQKSDEKAISLLKGAFPATALELLFEWEETLGLPDECSISESDSIDVRQSAVVSKLISSGGISKAYFIDYFERLGYTITIKEYRQARAGWSVAGESLNGEDWPFTWKVIAPESSFVSARAGKSYAGDPLRSGGNKALECTLRKIAPPFTIYLIEYLEIGKKSK